MRDGEAARGSTAVCSRRTQGEDPEGDSTLVPFYPPPGWLQWLGLAVDVYQQYAAESGQLPAPADLPAWPGQGTGPLDWPPSGTEPYSPVPSQPAPRPATEVRGLDLRGPLFIVHTSLAEYERLEKDLPPYL